MSRRILLSLAIPPLLCLPSATAQDFDLVVYGGVAGGVVTAVSAAREGLKVALLEPRNHLGGLVSGGLTRTDYGKKEVIGGYSLEYFWRVGNKYHMRQYGTDAAWYFEPKVAEEVFRDMVKEAGVQVFYHHRLRDKNGVRKTGPRVEEIFTENGASFRAKIFADSSYEGDLMAQAGISYTWGREGMAQYGESLAGVRDKTPKHQFLVPVSPYDDNRKLLPEIHPEPLEKPGTADKKVQTYNFRLCLTNNRANLAPYPKPRGYSPRRYALLARLFAPMEKHLGRPLRMRDFWLPYALPNQKIDVNNHGAFSTDYIGGSWEYPEAGYRKRAEIWQAHTDYIQGFLYFMANDPQAPATLRDEISQWGLAKDEFTDTAHWPHQLYVREARRMVGEYVMIQKDLQTDRTKPDPIGMGSYNSDSHNVQRVVTSEGLVMTEGDMQVPVQPYQISYRAIVPKRGEAHNLLVPVCFSASHVAYSSMRMEPQYMIIGQAAGVAARMAIDTGKPVQDIDTRALTEKLRRQGAVLEYVPSPQLKLFGVFNRGQEM